MGEVAAGVKSHTAYGLGAYCYFEAHPVHAANGFQTPEGNNIFLQNLCTVFLSGNDDSQITHVINGEGGTASHDTADRPQYICKPSGNGPEPSQPTTEPNNNGGGNSGTVTTKAAVSGTACCQVQGSNQCMPESSQWWCNESSGNCLGACNDSGDKVWGVPGQPGQTGTTASPTSAGASAYCQVSGTNTCMPESSQWWCNESSANCLGACNDSGDKVWGVPSAESANAMRQDTIEITAEDWVVYGFAATGLGFLLYGAFRHFNGKTSEYTPVNEGQVA